jgi:hypothetical protein
LLLEEEERNQELLIATMNVIRQFLQHMPLIKEDFLGN